VLVLAIVAALRGRTNVAAWRYNIAHSSVYRAMAVSGLGLVLFALALLALQLTQNLTFSQAVFESLSALGTVGLSLGGTEHLDSVGKVIVIIVMFAGRIGPLTLFLVLGEREGHDRWDYPEREIPTG
jgi:trk system potassium uptake protein TrkH